MFRDEIEIRQQLGHAVLDLESGVDLEEPETAIGVEEEFGRRRVVQVRRACRPDRQVVQRRALVGGEPGCRRFLDQLLVPALDRTVPLPQRHDRAAGVAEQLDLDVARRTDLALQVDRPVAECRRRLRRTGGQRRRQLGRSRNATHPATPTPGRRLHEQGEPDRLRGRDDRVDAIGSIDGDRVERPRDHRHAGGLRRPPRSQLVAKCLDRIGSRSDEDEPGVDHRPREAGPLRQEAVAGVDRLRTGL